MKKFFYLIFILFTLTACQDAKDALTLQKKPSSDEFLVEKKNPLVLPPDYSELPVPKNEKNIIEKENESIDLSKVLKKSDKKEEIKNKKNLEKTILDKIEKK